jgi:hypothetical protein
MPEGRGEGPPLLVIGGALVALAAFLGGAVPLPGTLRLLPLVPFAAGLALLWAGFRRRREARYDLRGLFEAPPAEEEPRYDTVPDDEASSPYCGWCDEAYPPGTYRCTRCGREL